MSLTSEDKEWLLATFATKTELQRLPTHAGLEALADKIREDLERVETKLLTAFQQWASPLEMRMRTHTAALRALDAEVEYHEDRQHPDQNAAA